MMHKATSIKTIMLLVAVSLALSACGRRPSTLSTPYEAAIDARKQAERDDLPLPPEPKKPEQDRRFILDGLI